MKTTKLEAVLWSIALPGFGQLLNGQIVKGIVFIILEFLINVFSQFNTSIMYSFNGDILNAMKVLDYEWLMFYPCVYMYAMYDAYKFGQGKTHDYAFLPFVFGAYFVTVGLMLSSKIKLFNVLLGPVFFPMLSLLPGLAVGFMLRIVIIYFQTKKAS
ncbi:hypothetical protein ACFFIX_04175 [Metabacillus herbersteinensis]|uniref:Uncharacterized protein n=1 Tax=Metabacillus herbersteinensis TaxID=283816 RepID=A0ABV6GAD7_9BACI